MCMHLDFTCVCAVCTEVCGISPCLDTCVYECVCACMDVRSYVCVFVCMCVCVCSYVHAFVCACACQNKKKNPPLCVHVCMYICMLNKFIHVCACVLSLLLTVRGGRECAPVESALIPSKSAESCVAAVVSCPQFST